VSDLSNTIVNLQSLESKLSKQIKSTSDVLGKQPTYLSQSPPDRRSNIVLYGVKDCAPKALRHERLQNAALEIFGGINIQLNPTHILDCFCLGKFQSKPRPILIKLQRMMDANIILANRASLSPPHLLKPDMFPEDRAIESILLKEQWSLIQSGHNRKQICVFNPSNLNITKIKILSLNCCSLRSSGKRANFIALVDENDPDVICGCESHLDSQYYTFEIFPSNYTVFRKDRIEGGGGVFLCVRETLNVTEQPVLNLNAEIVWAKITLAKRNPIYICSFYRPPDPSSTTPDITK